MEVKIKRIHEDAIIPTFGSEYAAGADLYSIYNTMIYSGNTEVIHTGISIEIPEGYVGLIFARSGWAGKRGLAPANKVGVVDSDYRGEILVYLHNHGYSKQEVVKGDRIAQLMIVPYPKIEFVEVDELSDTNRGDGGFGSTGN